MSEDISQSAKEIESAGAYESPAITVIGKVKDLTAGPITVTDESPSGMRGS